MDSLIDVSKNYSFFAVPIAVFLTIAPEVIGKSFAPHRYDKANPRTYIDNVNKDESIDKVTKQKIARCYAASANGLESLPLFATGILAASHAGVPNPAVNYLAAGFLACRALFIWIYIWLSVNKNFAPLRSLAWVGSTVCWLTLWVKAAMVLSAA